MKVEKLNTMNNLENIPHMLRNLAHEIELGNLGEVNGLLVVADCPSNAWPKIFGFGPVSILEDVRVIGLLELAKAFIVNNNTGR